MIVIKLISILFRMTPKQMGWNLTEEMLYSSPIWYKLLYLGQAQRIISLMAVTVDLEEKASPSMKLIGEYDNVTTNK